MPGIACLPACHKLKIGVSLMSEVAAVSRLVCIASSTWAFESLVAS